MKLLPALTIITILATPAFAQEPLRIGLSLPLSGPYKLLGEQARTGAQAAVTALGSTRAVELTVIDDKCTLEGGKMAAQTFIAAKVEAVAGFLCTAPLTEHAKAFAGTSVPLVTTGVRTVAITSKRTETSASIFRLAPASSQELDAVSNLLVPLWRDKKFAIVDDGTLRARELAESLRLAAEGAGLKPVFVDTFKPGLEDQFALLNRLKNAGAKHVFVGGDREDIAILAENALSKKYVLTIAASETLNAAPLDHALPDGVLMVGTPVAKGAQINTGTDTVAEGYFLPTFAAIELIVKSSMKSNGSKPLDKIIVETTHETVAGTIKFAPNGDLMDNPYAVLISRAGNFEIYQQ
jgi:branched-chain amino acid transport system substrate-binding protein